MFLFSLFSLSSCYDDYVDDYAYSITYFSSQKPMRTVIADRNMTIKVGVSIGGKRAVDLSDWAKFEIDSTLLVGTTFTLLPEEYYTLSDSNTFRVSNKNLPIADVVISFTDAFYADSNSANKFYALPFKLTESSLDSINPLLSTSIVAIKYISTFHGAYYLKGTLSELDGTGNVISEVIYKNPDLSKNLSRDIFTVSTNTIQRPGLANYLVSATEAVRMNVIPNNNADKIYPITIETPAGCLALTNTEGTYDAGKAQPEIHLKYDFTKAGKFYRVEETLVLRQDPLKDLRFEEWN
jgi:hypothetical protein